MQDKDEFLKLKDVCAKLNLGDRAVRDLMKRGMLPYYRFYWEYRFKPEDIDKFIKEHKVC